MTEYPFDTVRVLEGMLLTARRAQYPDVKMIFAHDGGAIPYLASRIAGMASLPWLDRLSVPESLAQLAGYYFDTAASTSAIQLTALKSFVGMDQIVTGTDCKLALLLSSRNVQLQYTNSCRSVFSCLAGVVGISCD